jgi:glycosyltransferase involved in cell wall biosynthesis
MSSRSQRSGLAFLAPIQMTKPTGAARRILFAYWGRRGALSRFTLNLARTCQDIPELDATISVSRQNESFDQFLPLGPKLLAVQTFTSGIGALIGPHRIARLRRDLLHRVVSDRIEAVVTLMPHVWSPLVSPAIRRQGVRYLTVVHDADPHIGDRTGIATRWLLQDTRSADRVITLSASVAERLVATGHVSRSKITTLFHPDLAYGAGLPRQTAVSAGRPLRCLFFGRIMPYKGLPLLLDAWELLRREGLSIEVGVYGEGDLADCADRLHRFGAEVVNEWIAEDRIAAIFDQFDVVVLPYIEASQSGIAAIAMASGLPIVATPVGGLVEQVRELETGVLAQTADAAGFAQAIRRLVLDASLHQTIQRRIAINRDARTMRRFVESIVAEAFPLI